MCPASAGRGRTPALFGVRSCVTLLAGFPFVEICGPRASQRAVQYQTRLPQVTLRRCQRGLRAQEGVRRRQEILIFTHSGGITPFLQRRFGPSLLRPGSQQGMPAAVGLQPCQGGLDLVDRTDHGTPVGRGRFIPAGLGEINIAAQP